MTKMNERTINTLFNIVSDPIKNAYNAKDNKNLSEIQNIIRVLKITNEQRVISKEISARGLVAFKMLVSNN